MAIFTGEYRSEVLGMNTELTVIIPYDVEVSNQQRPCKVLYLLHGLYGSHSSWVTGTNIKRYAESRGFAVVMPSANNSFYTNMKYGQNYFKFVTDELPKAINMMFNLSQSPKDTYIAGLSMGGYGALKCALTYPENYAGCASFSGAVNINILKYLANSEDKVKLAKSIFGEELDIKPENDLFALAEKTNKVLPLYISCGTEDDLYQSNVDFSEFLNQHGVAHKFEVWSGTHSWDFWDESIIKALDFFLWHK